LTSLPPLNANMFKLLCYDNPLTCIPNLNGFLQCIIFYNTPIYDLLDGKQQNIENFNHFRKCYFIYKMEKNFISWMWKVREKKAKEQFHYKHLFRFIEEHGEDADLEPFLENFT
jgi:hypothetical protein